MSQKLITPEQVAKELRCLADELQIYGVNDCPYDAAERLEDAAGLLEELSNRLAYLADPGTPNV